MNLFITYLWKEPRLFFAVAVVVVLSISIHEFMHAYVALKCGDDTAAKSGHLTLNPLKQMGPFSLLLFCLFGLAWGSVPVDPRKMRGRYAPALVAFAGPASNVVLTQFFLILAYVCFKKHIGDEFAVAMLLYASNLNVVLFLLNMLPVPGFDGFAVLSSFFPGFLRDSSEVVRGTVFLLIMLLFVFFNQLFTFARFVTNHELLVLEWLFG
ncbi:MAG: site-2 protease family protein [Lentisphaeria bacterium]|nr:site-2 protease family protein [Lentisphaeria bacterium]